MKTLFALTKNTFKEAIRDRILFVIVFFAVFFVLSSQLAAEISAKQNERIVLDFGLAMINIFGVLITIFVGINLVHKELERKTILILLAKPIPRFTFILSKFFGLGAVLVLAVGLMSVIFFFLSPFSWNILGVILMMYFSFMLLLAVVLFFSSFINPMLAGFASLLTYVIGHITTDLRVFADHYNVSETFHDIAYFIFYTWPNFETLNLKNVVVYDFVFTFSDVLHTLLITFLFIVLLLISSTLIFSRKEF